MIQFNSIQNIQIMTRSFAFLSILNCSIINSAASIQYSICFNIGTCFILAPPKSRPCQYKTSPIINTAHSNYFVKEMLLFRSKITSFIYGGRTWVYFDWGVWGIFGYETANSRISKFINILRMPNFAHIEKKVYRMYFVIPYTEQSKTIRNIVNWIKWTQDINTPSSSAICFQFLIWYFFASTFNMSSSSAVHLSRFIPGCKTFFHILSHSLASNFPSN